MSELNDFLPMIDDGRDVDGGMEVASIRLTFRSATLRGLMYRTPDGKIQQLLFEKG